MSEPMIHKAILAVMRDVGAIDKGAENTQQKYKYRSVEQVYNRVQPLFAKHGVFTYPKVLDQTREAHQSSKGGTLHYAVLTMEYTFAAADGSSIAVVVVGEAMDSGDKASNKAMAAAHKYALCQVLNIPYQVIDPDKFTPEWAAALDNHITLAQLTQLKRLWAERDGAKLKGQDRGRLALAFSQWAKGALKHEFDAADFRQWTAEDLQEAERILRDA